MKDVRMRRGIHIQSGPDGSTYCSAVVPYRQTLSRHGSRPLCTCTYHFTVNGKPACQAAETADPRLDPPTTCAHSSRESCEADAQRVRDLYPDAAVKVLAGRCTAPRTEYDLGYRDGYEAGLRAAREPQG